DLLAKLDIRAFEANNQRNLETDFLHGSNDTLGDDIALHDAAEDVDEDALDLRVRRDDLEGRSDLLLAGAAADVTEVRRLLAVELDDIHRRHGEAGAVDHAADIAVERHIGEIPLGGLDFLGVLFRFVARRLDVVVAEQRVAGERPLGFENA